MGKASKWFRSILGLKKIDSKHQPPPPPPSSKQPHKDKRRWSFVKSYREKDSAIPNNKPAAPKPNSSSDTFSIQQQLQKDSVSAGGCEVEDSDTHAMAVAAATAAVAEAAVAAAQAAAAVVRLTSISGRCAREAASVSRCELSEELAAVRIQSAFRGYLARRASRALKGLVRLQALVRGHIERKKTAERLRWMQAMLRAQARARAGRAQISESSQSSSKSSQFHHHGPPTPEKIEYATRSKSSKYEKSSMLKRNGSKSSGRTLDNHGWNRSDRQIDEQTWDQSDKILEVDTGKPHSKSKHRNLFHSTPLVFHSDLYSCSFTNSRESHHTGPSPESGELKFADEVEESPFCTADNSPQFYSASSKGGSCRRSPSSCRSYLSGYSDHPNYMSNTESSRAKVRSLSAPKQRPQFERSSSTKRYSIHGLGELKSNTYKPSLHANFVSKAYPGSGRLDRLGMPVGYRY